MNLEYDIQYVSRIDGTKVLPFIIDAYVALRKSGNIDAFDCPVSGKEESFYIENRRKRVVAVLSFFKEGADFVINMGFVDPAYRNRGMYRVLWNRLVEEGRSRNLDSILGYHKPGNDEILGVNKHFGRGVKYICSEYIL